MERESLRDAREYNKSFFFLSPARRRAPNLIK